MKPTALIISPDYPYPPSEGGLLRVYHLITTLQTNYTVDLLTLSSPSPQIPCGYPSLKNFCRQIDSIPAKFPKKDLLSQLLRTAYCIRHKLSPRADVYVNNKLMQEIVSALAKRSYDLIILEHSWIANYHSLLQPMLNPSGIMILDLHNIESDLKKEFSIYSDNFSRSYLNKMFSRFASLQEMHWLPKFDHLFTTSEHDRERINKILYGSEVFSKSSHISVIPNSIDVEFYTLVRKSTQSKRKLLFCGGLDYPPNKTAINFLVHRVLPNVQKIHRDCELLVVGKDDHYWKKPTRKGVTFTGYVPDIRPYIEDSSIILAPILNGSGTRFKVLESWAARRPLIATTKAVEGLEATATKHFLLANTPSDFSECINKILSSPEQTHDMVDAAHSLVNTKYNTRITGKYFLETLRKISHRNKFRK